jgi:hypothetical protein
MVTVVKNEWHQVVSQFSFEFTEELLSEIYPDLDESEIKQMIQDLEEDEIDPENIVNDALEAGIEIEWQRDHDDWWTERKGGFDVTYEIGE